MKKVGFIGAGNMGYAIIKGISNSPISSDVELFAFDKNVAAANLLEIGVKICNSEAELTDICEIVFLAVKPQVMGEVLSAIAPSMNPKKVLVSIAAGISAEYIRNCTIPEAKVILVMPNTPLILGQGSSAIARSSFVTDDDFSLVMNIFASCGYAAEVPEDKIKEVIAINGSSPAFTYLFAKGFLEYAQSVGIDSDTALSLFSKTLIGSAKMLTDSGYGVDDLIKMVSSPGGTTLAGLDALYEGKMKETVIEACKKCTARAYELSK